MSDRPILFSASMIRALIDGRKTMTRRVLKPAPFVDAQGNFCAPDRKGRVWNWGQHIDGRPCTRNYAEKHIRIRPGDRLWVREAWAKVGDAEDDIHACPDLRVHAYYRADAVDPERQKWRSPVFMPRWASRLTLNVTDVRVQRLQDIKGRDIIAEGTRCEGCYDTGHSACRDGGCFAQRIAFENLWEQINGAGSWDANPWVAAYTFVVEHRNIDAGGSHDH